MSEPFIAQINMFGGNFAPRGWASCDGQLLPITQNTALFSLLGTTFGGDGRSTFGLPDLRGRVPIHEGTGPGLTPRTIGEKGGLEQVALNPNQIPPHSHPLNAASNEANTDTPSGGVALANSRTNVYHNSPPAVVLHPDSIGNTGGGQSHNNVQPFLAINFIIAMQGLYPSRS